MKIALSKLLFEIELLDDNAPAGLWGPRLRGGYGDILRRELCVRPDITDCSKCRPRSCDFPILFKPTREDLPGVPPGKPLAASPNLPGPYVISAPLAVDHDMRAGSRLMFEFLSLGVTNEISIRVIDTFGKLGVQGLDVRKGSRLEKSRFQLIDVRDLFGAGRSLRAGNAFCTPTVLDAETVIGFLSPEPAPDEAIIEFVSPVTLYFERSPILRGATKDSRGRIARVPADFYDLTEAVVNRIGPIWQAYGDDWPGQAEYFRWKNATLAAAKNVEIIASDLKPDFYQRFSKEMGHEVRMDGFIGAVHVSGNLTGLLMPYLLGEFLHIGESTAFGFGQYKMAY